MSNRQYITKIRFESRHVDRKRDIHPKLYNVMKIRVWRREVICVHLIDRILAHLPGCMATIVSVVLAHKSLIILSASG